MVPRRAALVAVVVLLGLLAPAAAQAAPPPNDLFAAAQVLTGETASATGSNLEATKETGEPNHAGYAGTGSVWFTWTAPRDGVAVVSKAGSFSDSTVGVYTGATVDGLTTRASMGWSTNTMQLTVKGGEVLRIAVDGSYGAKGTLALSVTLKDPPDNDAFAKATQLTGETATDDSTTVVSSKEPGEPAHAGFDGAGSVWWTWTAPRDAAVTLDTAGSSQWGATLAVYTGDSVAGLVPVASGSVYETTVRVRFRAVAGTTYRIAFDRRYSSQDGAAVKLNLATRDLPPNDAFAAATDLGTADAVSTMGHATAATNELGEPSHDFSYDPPRGSVWYAWTATKRGSVTINAQGADAEVLAAYTGASVSSLTRVPLQAQECCGGKERIRIRVEAGTTYRIAVAARYTSGVGDFTLALSRIDSPANDDFAEAELIAGPSVDVAGTNVGATQEAGEPIHDDNYYDPSVWYSWTAPTTAGVTLDTAGSALETIAAVYTGDSVGALTRVPSARALGTTRAKRHFRAVAGTTYRIAIDGAQANQGTFSLTLRTRPAPANDMFAAAQPLAGTTVDVSGDTVAATGEPGEPSPGGTAGATVWYAWTAPANGKARISSPTRDFAGNASVYTGEQVGSLTRVAGSRLDYGTSFRTVAGTTYRIAVDGGSIPARGEFSLRLVHATAPANDDLANAVTLTSGAARTTGTNVAATKEPGEPTHYGYGGASVWYAWTAPVTGRATITMTTAAWWDTAQAAYTGSSLAELTRVASSDYNTMSFRVTKGVTYRLAVDGYYGGDEGPFEISADAVEAPPNDEFADATVLTGSADAVSGTTTGATRQSYEPSHAGRSAMSSVWYRWRAPASGPVTVDTGGSAVDTLLGVYTGTSADYLTTVTSNDDIAGTTAARVTFTASAGQVYRIAVDSRSAGAIALALSHATPPANDAFASATTLTGPAASADGTTVGATRQAGEPQHAGNRGGASAWYAWTAPATGSVKVSSAGSAFNTLLAAYTGGALASLTPVASNDDAGTARTSEVTFPVTEGTTYRIAVDAFDDREGPVQGALKLAVELTPDPAPIAAPVQDPPADDPPAKTDPPVVDPPKTEQPATTDPVKNDAPTTTANDPAPPKDEPAPPKDEPAPPKDEPATAATTTTQESAASTTRSTPQRTPAFTAPDAAPPPVAPLRVTGGYTRVRLDGLLRRGFVGHVECSRACQVTATLSLDRKQRGRAASVLPAQVVGTSSRTYTLRLSPAVRRALRSRGLRLTATVVATGADGSTTRVRRAITLIR